MKIFIFHATRHEGPYIGAIEACHNVYMLGDKAEVHISSAGRYHVGRIEFEFFDFEGNPCSISEWSKRHLNIKPARYVKQYKESGLHILLSSGGRSHSACFSVHASNQAPPYYVNAGCCKTVQVT